MKNRDVKVLDGATLLRVCESLYSEGLADRKGGATLVYDLANSLIESGYNLKWSYCEFCDTETPRLHNHYECLVCGSPYAYENLMKELENYYTSKEEHGK